MTRYFAPASTGNFTVGFDLLGLALAPESGALLGDVLDVDAQKPVEQLSLTVSGRYAHQLPADARQNVVFSCHQAFERALGKPLPRFAMHLQKNLPVGSGLGSSACSIVVACHALNECFGRPLDQQRLLQLMAECEGGISGSIHYDNVAPSYFGGLQLMLPHSAKISRHLPWFGHWRVVVCYPGTTVSTKAAREVMPASVERATAVEFAGLLSRFVSALYAGDEAEALDSLHDVLAEPHRQALIPELMPLRVLFSERGIAHLGISGSGPTLFALCTSDAQAQTAAQLLTARYGKNTDAMTHICRIAESGVRAL
ncbi:MAG: homoserine kinase [Arenimonas sp.]|nr:homoserine kinase [Arenimonas sp.]MBP7917183.1 homoserine kinase [Arenimonas sp.]